MAGPHGLQHQEPIGMVSPSLELFRISGNRPRHARERKLTARATQNLDVTKGLPVKHAVISLPKTESGPGEGETVTLVTVQQFGVKCTNDPGH